ncbi:MAG: hypothetical protein EGR97_11265 [Clostridiales bacterium]|jgi:hypothetical protein|nr:hypothetical protein [Clostridiales bacterium]
MNTPIYAYYFPNWHVTPQNEIWHGKGWTEWQCVKYATPRFPGHVQPKVPLWGYEDESDPNVAAKKIACALKFGISGFIFDWYWYPEIGPYRIDCLEKGFFGAENFNNFQFAVMWCNHTPIAVHPALYYFGAKSLIEKSVTKESFFDLTEHCIHRYFKMDNYIRVDGKPYFGIYSLNNLVAEAGINGAKEMIADLRNRARAAGVGEIVISVCPSLDDEADPTLAKQVGIDMLVPYAWKGKDNCLTYEYRDSIDSNLLLFQKLQKQFDLPLCPSVMIGRDHSPRTVQSEIFDPARGYPYSPIAVNNKPESVGGAVSKMLECMHDGTFHNAFLALESWNEWTEGSYLEPCEEYGYQMLEAIRSAASQT